MPFANHYRISLSGVLGLPAAPIERFSMRLNMSRPTGGGSANNPLVDIADVAADASRWFARTTTRISNAATLTEVKVAAIDGLGLYEGNPAILPVNVTGSGLQPSENPGFPFQVAWVASLETGERGAAKRGRIFQPCPVSGELAQGVVSVAAATDVATSLAQFITDLNNWPGVDAAPSSEVVIASSKGFNTKVNGVRVGRALDTLRTRRRSVPEAYPVTVPAG